MPEALTSLSTLPAYAVRVLRDHRVKQAEERLALGPYWEDSGLVFTSTIGTVIEPRNLARTLDRLMRGRCATDPVS